MEIDWKGRVILTKLALGQTYVQVSEAADIFRQGLWKRMQAQRSVNIGGGSITRFGG